ncbi:MAG: hypothetical protein OXG15_09740 [Gammaproteobacteria bacterium]|nr:hypothetical protein [Gammaproteobacteria bacterium]
MMLLLSMAGEPSAGSLLHCRVEQQQLNDTLYQRFVENCGRIYAACMDYREEVLGEPSEKAEDNCVFPVENDPEFSGPCPELLYELESPKYDDIDSVIARVRLRDWFMTESGNSTIRFYKQADSLRSIRKLITVEPNNLQALFYERHNKHLLEIEEDVIASLNSAIKIYELDPNCSRDWMFNPNEIVNLINDLLIQRATNDSNVAALSKLEFSELANAAFVAMQSQYEHVYSTSENIRKLDYAKRLIEHPFLFLNEDLAKELGSVLNVDPEGYMDARRRLVTKELIDLYVGDPTADEKQSLGMICNSYAFEIGLAEQCLALVDEAVHHYDRVQRPLPAWVWEAAMSLSITASQACDRPSSEDDGVFKYLHCTFCFYASECLVDEGTHINKQLFELLENRRMLNDRFEYYLIKSYAQSNEESVRSFRRSVELSNAPILHSLLLAKRLQNRGYRKSAISLLDIALARVRELNVRAVVLVDHDYLGSETCNSTFRLRRNTRDLTNYVSEVEEMRKLLSEDKTYDFYEFGHCGLRWDN